MNARAGRFVEVGSGTSRPSVEWRSTFDRVCEGVNDVPQEQEQKRVQRKDGGAEDDDAGQVASTEKGEKLREEMDEILDEIDSVLEENAEEFVKSYVQKGGE